MKTSAGKETLKRESEFQVRRNFKKDASARGKYCDRGDALLSSSGVCFESGADRDVAQDDGSNANLCSPGSCFECGL